MSGKRFLLFFSLLIVGIGYISYVRYPEECDFPISIKIAYSVVRLLMVTCNIVEKLGGNYCVCMRLSEIDRSPMLEEIEITKENFGGVSSLILKPHDFEKSLSKSAIIYYHGGGWAVGSFATYALYMKKLTKESGMLIVFPEYRLAPEHKYPAPFDDCLRATLDFMKRAKDFNVDPNKIVFAGDSAGGNLAIAVGLNIHKHSSEHKPCMMNLIYPVIQLSNFMLPSYQQNPNPPLVSPEDMVRFYLLYMGITNETELIQPMANNLHMIGFKDKEVLQRTSSDWVPERFKQKKVDKRIFNPTERQRILISKYKHTLQNFAVDSTFAPLSATDTELRTLPRTHIVTSEYDVLRDDGVILHERMRSIGLNVSHQNLQFAAHGVLNFYGMHYGKLDDAVASMLDIIKGGLAQCQVS